MTVKWPPKALVWAKLPEIGWWPCRVEELSNLPEPFRESKLPENQKFYPVYCFGSYEYRWAHENLIKSFKTHLKSYQNKSDSHQFQAAIKECTHAASASNFDDSMTSATESAGIQGKHSSCEDTVNLEYQEEKNVSCEDTVNFEYQEDILSNVGKEKMSIIHDQFQYLLNAPIALHGGQTTFSAYNSQQTNSFFSFDPAMNSSNSLAGETKYFDSQSTRHESLESPFALSSQFQNFENISSPFDSQKQTAVTPIVESPDLSRKNASDESSLKSLDWKTLLANKIGFDLKNVDFQKRMHIAKGIKHFLVETCSKLEKDAQAHTYLIPKEVQEEFIEWFQRYEANNWIFEGLLVRVSDLKDIVEPAAQISPPNNQNEIVEQAVQQSRPTPITKKISLKILSNTNTGTPPLSNQWEPKPDEVVWSKNLDSHWWPSKIEQPEAFPMDPEETPANSEMYRPVYFFGSHEYAWISKTDILEFEKNFDSLSGKCTLKKFKTALQECYDPESWPSREYTAQLYFSRNQKKPKASSSGAGKRAAVLDTSDEEPMMSKVKSKKGSTKKASAQKKKRIQGIEDDSSDDSFTNNTFEKLGNMSSKPSLGSSSKKKSSTVSSFSKKEVNPLNRKGKAVSSNSVGKSKLDSFESFTPTSQSQPQSLLIPKTNSIKAKVISKRKEFTTPATNPASAESINHSAQSHQISPMTPIMTEEDRQHREKIRKIELEQAEISLRQTQAQAKLEILTSKAIARKKLLDSGVPESEIASLLEEFST